MSHRGQTKNSQIFNKFHCHTVKNSAIFQRFNTIKSKNSSNGENTNFFPFNNQSFIRHSSQNKINNQLNPQILSKTDTSNSNKVINKTDSKLKKAHTFIDHRISSTCEKEEQRNRDNVPSFVKKKSQGRNIKSQTNQINDRFKIIKKLGEGKFGKVHLVVQKTTNMIFAMKVVEKQIIKQRGFITQFIREVKLQTFLQHPNIIKLYGFFHDTTKFYLLFECGCDGQLYLKIQQSKFTQSSASVVIRRILQAIKYMHQRNVLHRDIKPQNIVIVHGVVKLCDLGWAVNTQKQQLRQTFCGTPLYLSPELIKRDKYDQKVDLWAIGVLCFQLIYKVSPFLIQNQQHLRRIVTNSITYPQNPKPSDTFKKFIQAILQKDPKQRLSAKQLLEFDFITQYINDDSCQELIH